MLILISGQPGNGKTLRALDMARVEYERNAEAVKAGKEEPRKFFSNIAGATLAENPDAFPWMEQLPDHNDWTKLPDGSFVVYDEAHSDGNTPGLERYGLLFPSTGKPGESSDPRIRAMSTHRHRGFDIVFVTQWPSKIHHQVRTLVGKHVHMNRSMGLQRAGVYTWTRVQADPYDERQREKGEEEIWSYPADLYGRYKSASLHTSTYKFKVPGRVWGGLSMLVMGLLVAWGLWVFVFKSAPYEGQEAAQAEAPNGAGALPVLSFGSSVPSDADAYLAQQAPRVPDRPWSAPLYDGRNATVDPQLICMISRQGLNAQGKETLGDCVCMTEQGTRYDLPTNDCRRVARWGQPYNPFRERVGDGSPDASTARQEPPVGVHGGPLVSAAGFGDASMPVARYGGFRGEQTGPDRYQSQGW